MRWIGVIFLVFECFSLGWIAVFGNEKSLGLIGSSFSDKSLHTISCLVITMTFYWTISSQGLTPASRAIITFLSMCLFAFASEGAQFVLSHGRHSFDIFDSIADIYGLILGLAIIIPIHFIHHQFRAIKTLQKISLLPIYEDRLLVLPNPRSGYESKYQILYIIRISLQHFTKWDIGAWAHDPPYYTKYDNTELRLLRYLERLNEGFFEENEISNDINLITPVQQDISVLISNENVNQRLVSTEPPIMNRSIVNSTPNSSISLAHSLTNERIIGYDEDNEQELNRNETSETLLIPANQSSLPVDIPKPSDIYKCRYYLFNVKYLNIFHQYEYIRADLFTGPLENSLIRASNPWNNAILHPLKKENWRKVINSIIGIFKPKNEVIIENDSYQLSELIIEN